MIRIWFQNISISEVDLEHNNSKNKLGVWFRDNPVFLIGSVLLTIFILGFIARLLGLLDAYLIVGDYFLELIGRALLLGIIWLVTLKLIDTEDKIDLLRRSNGRVFLIAILISAIMMTVW